MQVTPWQVKGDIDYGKLIKEFGTTPIDARLLKRIEKYAPLNVMLRRGYFFSHRELNKILDDYEAGKGFFLYTGRAASGPMHIGHLTSFMITKWFQDIFDVNVYIQFPDEEKFLAKEKVSIEEINHWTKDNMLDIIALGFNPDKTFIFQNREYVQHMYTLACRAAKKVTFSTMKAVFGFNNSTNVGISFYPIMQIVPTFFEKKRCLIPAAIDQDNYWRIQRDIAESLGYCKTAAIHSKFIPPLTGIQGKMSSSDSQKAILLTDDAETIKKKVMKYAFSGGQATVEEHRKKGGNPDIDVAFQWLSILFMEDDDKLKRIKDDYSTGRMLTGELKQILVDKLTTFLEEHRKKRERADVEMFKYNGKLSKRMYKEVFI